MSKWMNYLCKLKPNFLCVKPKQKGAFALQISNMITVYRFSGSQLSYAQQGVCVSFEHPAALQLAFLTCK